MKRNPSRLSGLPLVLLSSAAATGEAPPPPVPPGPLSLEECLRPSRERNPETAGLLNAGRAAVAEGRYRAGLATRVDLVDAATALFSARLRVVRSRLSVLQSFARRQRATGQDLLPAFDLPEPTLSLKGDGAPVPQGDPSP